MNQDPYVVFINSKGNAVHIVIVWLGTVLGPLCIFGGWGKFNEWPLYIGAGLIFLVLLSIKKGLRALINRVYSDFYVYGLIPILIPVITAISVWIFIV